MFYVKNEENQLSGPFSDSEQASRVANRIDGLVVDLNFDNYSSGANVDPVTVYASVEGGVVDFDEIPKGIRVVVYDYDIEGYDADSLTEDNAGHECVERVFESNIN